MQNAREVLQREKESMTRLYENRLVLQDAKPAVAARKHKLDFNTAFLKQRAKLRQIVRIRGAENRQAVFRNLPDELKATPEKSMDFVMACMAENQANRLAEINSDRPATNKYTADRYRGFATLAVEQIWKEETAAGGKGPLHEKCKDKATLMAQIEDLMLSKKFADVIRKVPISAGLNSPEKLGRATKPVLESLMKEAAQKGAEQKKVPEPEAKVHKVEGPLVGEPKVEGAKAAGSKVEGPKVPGEKPAGQPEKDADSPKVTGPAPGSGGGLGF